MSTLPDPLTATVHFYLTSRDSAARLTEQPSLQLKERKTERGALEPTHILVNRHQRFQSMEGFGAAFTESAALNWKNLPPQQAEALLQDYFGSKAGHRYNLCRVHMNSCDFALGNYAHAEVAGDILLQHFNIDRDRQALIPMIQAAQKVAAHPIQLLMSPWSPPAWMKSNGQMNQGGHLLPEYAETWAQCYVRFIQAYSAEGVAIWGVSIQNEPQALQRWDSCIYTAEDERDFVRDHLGPALAQAGLGHIKIVIWDHNRDLMVERASTVYSDPVAASYVWGCGFHWYCEDHFDHLQLVHDAWPGKALLFTEGCQEGGPHHGSWLTGERYARSIINDLNRWTCGWIDWNLLLDETGGPNHVNNLCSAPMLADRATGTLLHQSSYYYIGHFARFIQRGARRLLCAATKQDLETTAFLNPDASTVVVVLNRTESPLAFNLRIDNTQCAAPIPARSIATFHIV
jgi:glucosylceramidase